MNQAREEERRARIFDNERTARERLARSQRIECAKSDLLSLFANTANAQQRGKKLEQALNRVFEAYGLLVKEAFHLVGNAGEGVVEQIDGVIELRSDLYFVEMKWYREPIGKAEIAEHLVRLMSRAEARGIFISASDYTEPAVTTCRDFLQHKLVALCHLQELVFVLERQHDLADFMTQRCNPPRFIAIPISGR